MPKRLRRPKTKLFAKVLIPGKEYKIILIYDTKCKNDNEKNNSYLQLQKNRKKIAKFQNTEVAIRRMMSEANYELNTLFNHE